MGRPARWTDPARSSPTRPNKDIVSGRAGRFIKISRPGGPDVLSGWPGPVILSFFLLFINFFAPYR
jgi:hypothetical protein